jgi:hypothetical protein
MSSLAVTPQISKSQDAAQPSPILSQLDLIACEAEHPLSQVRLLMLEAWRHWRCYIAAMCARQRLAGEVTSVSAEADGLL